MRLLFKWAGIFLGLLILVVLLTILSVATFFSPNHFKPVLTEQFMKYTGRPLTIEGPVSWRFFPYFGIKADHIVVHNVAPFQAVPFAEIDHAALDLRLIPLLHKKMESNGIHLVGMHLNLIKNREGKVDWQMPSAGAGVINKPRDYEAEAGSSPAGMSLPSVAPDILISELDIANSEIRWLNEQSQRSGILDHLEFHAKEINLLHPFSAHLGFDILSRGFAGHVDASGQVGVHWEEQLFSLTGFDLKSVWRKGHKKYSLAARGDCNLDLKRQLFNWDPLDITLDNWVLHGKWAVTDILSHPQSRWDFKIPSFDLKAWADTVGEDFRDVQVAQGVSGEIHLTSGATVALSGQVHIDDLQWHHVRWGHIELPLHYQNGVFASDQITAEGYQGKLNAAVKLSLALLPRITVQAKLTNIDSGALLKDLGQDKGRFKWTGAGNVSFKLETMGVRSSALLKNLMGTGQFEFAKGTLKGIDLGYYLNSARDFLKGGSSGAQKNTGQTDFSRFSGTVNIQNGILSNNDLMIVSDLFTTKGSGKLNLLSQQIDYHLVASLNAESASSSVHQWQNLYGVSVPITISGYYNAPNIQLETAQLVNAVAKEAFQHNKEKWEKKIKKFLGQ